jgi:heme exporter protein A
LSLQPTGAAIRGRGIEKSFGDWPVLWGLDLDLDWGQLVLLLGPNGAGKTTLLRILSTQVRPDSGGLTIAGFDHRRQANQARRLVGLVGHLSFLHQDLTCWENLMFYSRLFGLKNPQERVREVLSQVALDHRAAHRVRTLSNGMQKRASIARALLHQPRILLMDEPESGLDTESLAMLKSLVAEWTASGRTVVMTTHNTGLAGSIAGEVKSPRIGHMANGKVRFQGHHEETSDNDAAGPGVGSDAGPEASAAPPEGTGSLR